MTSNLASMSSSAKSMSLPDSVPPNERVRACEGPSTRPHGVPVPSLDPFTPKPWSTNPTLAVAGVGVSVTSDAGGDRLATHFLVEMVCVAGSSPEPVGGSYRSLSPSSPRWRRNTPPPPMVTGSLPAAAPGSSAAASATAPRAPTILVVLMTVMLRPTFFCDLRGRV
jgi:hypothetical protein